MYKRPSKNESEEDLLKQQEEFFKLSSQKKITPAAKVTTLNRNGKQCEPTKINIILKLKIYLQ